VGWPFYVTMSLVTGALCYFIGQTGSRAYHDAAVLPVPPAGAARGVKDEPMTIYVIKHKTFENTNVFTTDKMKIPSIIARMESQCEGTEGKWSYTTLVEGVCFEADIME
jgi:hypothetical protein